MKKNNCRAAYRSGRIDYSTPARSGGGEVLKVATEAGFMPFEYVDEKTGELLGFDMDLIRQSPLSWNWKSKSTILFGTV